MKALGIMEPLKVRRLSRGCRRIACVGGLALAVLTPLASA